MQFEFNTFKNYINKLNLQSKTLLPKKNYLDNSTDINILKHLFPKIKNSIEPFNKSREIKDDNEIKILKIKRYI